MRQAFGLIAITAFALFLVSWVARVDVSDRAKAHTALVSTTACGVVSGTTGTAVVLDDSRLLTAAHTVIGAGSVVVSIDGVSRPAEIIGLDPRTDLALLDVPGVVASALQLGVAQTGEPVRYANGEGVVRSAEITRRLEIRIEEERSTVRSSRFGFEIDATVELGDSGAGVFDDRGRLIGIIFGRSTTSDDRSFAVRSEEITELLEVPEQRFVCNPSEDRVLPAG